MNQQYLLIILFTLLYYPICFGQFLIYCGRQNCYDVLEITRDTPKSEIGKAYRLLAKKYHPDLHQGEEAKRIYSEKFKEIATAYEILRDDESRSDYDYMLDNPDEYYANYYRYYRRRSKIDVRLVVIVVVTIISIIQYFVAWQRYKSAIKHFLSIQKYRNKAIEIANQREKDNQKSASAGNSTVNKKGKNKLTKSEQKEEMEKLIKSIIEEHLDIKGSYAKPKIFDVLWFQFLILPYTIFIYFKWYFTWIWRFDIKKEPYGREEKLYLIRRQLGLGKNEFNMLPDEKIEDFLHMELWIKDNFKEWKKEEEETMKKKMAENPRYKQYRRYMRNHGPGRMTFEE